MCGEPAYETPSGSVCKNKHGGAPVLDKPLTKKTDSLKPASETGKQKDKKSEFDFSSIDPEKEWECFGTIVKDHPECKECPFAVKCEAKKNAK